MEKIKSTFPNILLSLTGICLVAGLALAATNKYTENAIAEAMASELQNAIRNVAPVFDNDPVEESYRLSFMGSDSLTIYPAKIGDNFIGAVIECTTKNGFSGLIRVMAGFDLESKLLNYAILEHNETPGLGSKMGEWFRAAKKRQNVVGRDMSKGVLKLTKDGGDIDAITAATISSRAFLEAINLAYAAFSGNPDALSAATTVDE